MVIIKPNRINENGAAERVNIVVSQICFYNEVSGTALKKQPKFKDCTAVALTNGVVMVIDMTVATLDGIMGRSY